MVVSIWQKMIFPVRRVWLALSARLKSRKTGQYNLHLPHHEPLVFLLSLVSHTPTQASHASYYESIEIVPKQFF